MEPDKSLFHMEAAGSLAPALEGAPSSLRHKKRTGRKQSKETTERVSEQRAQTPYLGGSGLERSK